MWRSLESTGWDVVAQRYDDRPYERHEELIAQAKHLNPDAIVYLGALDEGPDRFRPVPSPAILRRLRDVAPSIFLCGDASDSAWWATLDVYCAEECFSRYVSIDGTERDGFTTKLTPVDPRPYAPKPWDERTVPVGYTGSNGGERAGPLGATGAASPGIVSHEEMARWLCNCKVVVNSPLNGTGNADHVKGRVVEAGFAGACLLERRNGATARWFTPGVDYIEYENPDDAREKAHWLLSNPGPAKTIAGQFQERVFAEHNAFTFWGDLLL